MEQPLPRQLARAEGEHTACLLKALFFRLVAVVEDDLDAVVPVTAQKAEVPRGEKRAHRAAHAEEDPPQGKARGKGHAQEDEEIDKPAARVLGEDIVEDKHRARVRRGLDDIGKAREVLFLLQQRKLARQEDNERDLHDLGGLNGDGKILQKADAEPFADVVHAEPGAVAVSRQAKGRAQQQNEAEVERQQPLPFFSDLRHVDAGEQEVEQHAQQQAKSLNGNIFKGIAEMRGARDEHHAVKRGNGAQRQQHHIRLPHHIT